MSSTNDTISYSVGMIIAYSLKQQGITELDHSAFNEGVEAVLKGQETKLSLQEADMVFRKHIQTAQEEQKKAAAAEGIAFLEENAKRAEVTVTDSGLQYEVLEKGNGASPRSDQSVEVHYHGTLINGTVFDSSIERRKSITFPVTGVIPGWVEALQLMSVGDRWKLFIPQELAYGAKGAGANIPPYSALIFEVELISIL